MKRKIEDPCHYLDYRVLLNDDFLLRTATNSSYSLRAYCRDLNVSPGFLSQVMRGQKKLRPQTGRKLFLKLGFEAKELNYVENLITYKTSADKTEREIATHYIREHHKYPVLDDRPELDGYIKSADHFIIYGITRNISTLKEIQSIAEQLGITSSRVFEVLSDLLKEGYIRYKDPHYQVTHLDISIKTDSKILSVLKDFFLLLGRSIQKKGGIKVPNQVVQGLVLGLDKRSYPIAMEAHKHFIQSLNRLAAGSKKADQLVFVSSLLLAIDPKKSSSSS